MKRFLLISFLVLCSVENMHAIESKDGNPNNILDQMAVEIRAVNKKYEMLLDQKVVRKLKLNENLKNTVLLEEKVNILIEKDQIQDEMRTLQFENSNEISKIRYLKGLQFIKILYEKVLSLDHHFASVRTLNEINKISNPNQYPEYSKLKEILNDK